MILSDDRFIDAASLLGEQTFVSSTIEEVMEEVVCRLYGIKNETKVNSARFKTFIEKKKIPEPHNLPPTEDALRLHLMRVNYQVAEWKGALNSEHMPANPIGSGWILEDGNLSIHWTINKPAPEEILEFVSCSCKKSKCTTNNCQCRAIELQCTDLCGCCQCNNFDDSNESEEEDIYYDNDEYSDSDDVDNEISSEDEYDI